MALRQCFSGAVAHKTFPASPWIISFKVFTALATSSSREQASAKCPKQETPWSCSQSLPSCCLRVRFGGSGTIRVSAQ